jgi:hypothetical protein
VTQAIIGAKIAAIDPPTAMPKVSWKECKELAWLANAMLSGSSKDPVSTTSRGPMRSASTPQAKLARAIDRNAIVMAVEIPVVDQPVS